MKTKLAIARLNLYLLPVLCFALASLWYTIQYIKLEHDAVTTPPSDSPDRKLHRSFRFEITGYGRSVRNIFTARQLIVPANVTAGISNEGVLEQLVQKLPSGAYKVNSFFTGCFDAEWLHTDVEKHTLASSPSQLSHAVNCTSVRQPITRKVVVRASLESKGCCTHVSDVFGSGYWSNSGWASDTCYLCPQRVAAVFRMKDTFIHIAGDSVARGMLGTFCNKIGATKSHTIYDSNRKVKYRHCCNEGLSSCIIFRMSWHPKPNFSPTFVLKHLKNRENYCSESDHFSECMSTISAAAFSTPQSNRHVTWHWLFFGSHSPRIGASANTCKDYRKLSLADPNVIFFGTPAVREELIPEKYVSQRGIRTNARIAALNDMLAGCVSNKSFANLFTVSYSRKNSDFADAIHLKPAASKALSEVVWTAHLITSVPPMEEKKSV